LLNFQADNGIISSKDDEEAGLVESKTIEAFTKILSDKYTKEEVRKVPELEKLVVDL
jgi:hypothetical protein